MKKFIKKLIYSKDGQIGIIPILGIAGTIIVAIITGYFGQGNRTDAKITEAREEMKVNNLASVQRIAVLETDSSSIKEDIKEIKTDVKYLIKLLK